MLSDVGRALPFIALGAGVAAAVTSARRSDVPLMRVGWPTDTGPALGVVDRASCRGPTPIGVGDTAGFASGELRRHGPKDRSGYKGFVDEQAAGATFTRLWTTSTILPHVLSRFEHAGAPRRARERERGVDDRTQLAALEAAATRAREARGQWRLSAPGVRGRSVEPVNVSRFCINGARLTSARAPRRNAICTRRPSTASASRLRPT